MPFGPPPKLNLRNLILLFALAATLATLANNLLVTYGIQRQALVQNALEANRAYAAKLAASINENLAGDLERLRFSANLLGNVPGDTKQMALEAERLLTQDHSFNTVLVADAEGTVVASKPDSLGINGQALRSREALQQRRAMVSPAFRSLAGNLIVFVSHPIWGPDGQYRGLIGGTIYLGKPNALDSLVSQHSTMTRPTSTWWTRTARCCSTPTPAALASAWAPTPSSMRCSRARAAPCRRSTHGAWRCWPATPACR